MTLRICYRASCDRPRCRASDMVPHARTEAARAQLRAKGWTLLRWRVRKLDDDGRDVGGAGRMLVLCKSHGTWRPSRGREHPLARTPVPTQLRRAA